MPIEGIDRKQLEELADARVSVSVSASSLLVLVVKLERLEEELVGLKRASRTSSKPPSSDRNNPNKPDKKKRAGKGGKRGKLKRGKPLRMLNRFRDRAEEVMAFLIYGVPFDNNQAERDLRMMKTKQNISGCFRNLDQAQAFASLRSIISSAKKQAINVMQILRASLSNPQKAQRRPQARAAPSDDAAASQHPETFPSAPRRSCPQFPISDLIASTPRSSSSWAEFNVLPCSVLIFILSNWRGRVPLPCQFLGMRP